MRLPLTSNQHSQSDNHSTNQITYDNYFMWVLKWKNFDHGHAHTKNGISSLFLSLASKTIHEIILRCFRFSFSQRISNSAVGSFQFHSAPSMNATFVYWWWTHFKTNSIHLYCHFTNNSILVVKCSDVLCKCVPMKTLLLLLLLLLFIRVHRWQKRRKKETHSTDYIVVIFFLQSAALSITYTCSKHWIVAYLHNVKNSVNSTKVDMRTAVVVVVVVVSYLSHF